MQKLYKFVSGKFIFIPLSFFFAFILWVYYNHVGTFSFVDEYTNFVAGYFMNNGRELYKDIFYHHQLLPVYISFLIQTILQPDSLYQLILYHRMFVIVFGIAFDILLMYKFKQRGIFFVFIYELTKYYFFGNLFLAEALIVYPFVYLFGILWYLMERKNVSPIDTIVSGVFTWFIIFMREPFIPAALFLYGCILLYTQNKKYRTGSFLLFLVLSFATVFTTSIPDYFYNLITVNILTVLPSEVSTRGFLGNGLLIAFFYPITIFFSGEITFSRIVLILLNCIFFIGMSVLLIGKKK